METNQVIHEELELYGDPVGIKTTKDGSRQFIHEVEITGLQVRSAMELIRFRCEGLDGGTGENINRLNEIAIMNKIATFCPNMQNVSELEKISYFNRKKIVGDEVYLWFGTDGDDLDGSTFKMVEKAWGIDIENGDDEYKKMFNEFDYKNFWVEILVIKDGVAWYTRNIFDAKPWANNPTGGFYQYNSWILPEKIKELNLTKGDVLHMLRHDLWKDGIFWDFYDTDYDKLVASGL